MNLRRVSLCIVTVFCAAMVWAEPGFQSYTIVFGQRWTGNAYVPPDYNVTGSVGSPIDPAFGGGARFNLVDPFLFPSAALSIDPRMTISSRRFLLYPSGRVVPAPAETALGEENNEAGIGSARVLTFRVEAPVGLEIGLGEKAALSFALSPTLMFRLRAGEAEFATAVTDLNPMYSFFYGRMRWLRPDFHLVFRYDVSDYLAFALRSSTSVSILDMADATLPWWDQFQTGILLDLSLTPPLSGLFRAPEETREIALPDPESE